MEEIEQSTNKIKNILESIEKTILENFVKKHSLEDINEIVDCCKTTVIEILTVIQPSLDNLSKIVSDQSIFTNELKAKVEKFKKNFHDLTLIKEGDIVKDLDHCKGIVDKIIYNQISEDDIIYYGNKKALKRKDLKKVTEHQELIDFINS